MFGKSFNRLSNQLSSNKFRSIQSAVLFVLLFGPNTSAFAQSEKIGSRPDRGIVNGAAYSVSSIDAVNLQNGNVTVNIPLASLPAMAGGKLSYTLNATYNSKLWDVAREEKEAAPIDPGCPQYYTVETPVVSDAGGWRIDGSYALLFRSATADFNYIVPQQICDPYEHPYMTGPFGKILFRMPDGSEHEVKLLDYFPTYSSAGTKDFLYGYYKAADLNHIAYNGAKRFYTTDGSYIWGLVYPSSDSIAWTIYMKDGTQVIQYRDGVQKIKDTNGNSIKIFGDTNGTHYQDELTGRELRVSTATVNNVFHIYIHYQTVGAVWQTIDLVWGETQVFGKLFATTFYCPQTGGGGDPGIPATRTGYTEFADTISVLREIIFPATEQGVSPQKFTFTYNSDGSPQEASDDEVRTACNYVAPSERSASAGLGELSEITTPSGAKINYSYTLDGIHTIGALGSGNDTLPRNVITTKTLTHDGIVDTWNYDIGTLSISTGGSVVNPDGSSVIETFYPTDPAYARTIAGSDGKGGLVYRTNQSGKILTERQWELMPFSGAVTTSTGTPGNPVNFNPVVTAEYTSLLNGSGQAVKMSAKTFSYDYNGNLLETKDYDWFDLSICSVTRDSVGVPTAVPACAVLLRTSTSSYHNQAAYSTDTNVYAKRDFYVTPKILSAIKETTTGESITRFSYENQTYGTAPATTGNLTKVSSWLDYPSGQWIDSTIAYDSYGNAISATDAEGNVVEVVYGDSTHANPTSVTLNPNNGTGTQTSSRTFDFATGLILTETDANGHTSTIDYTNHLLNAVDPFGRPGIIYSPTINICGTNQRRRTKTFYEDTARKLRTETDLNAEGDGLLKSRTTADQLGRAILSESSENGVSCTVSSQSVYQNLSTGGTVTLTSNPTRNNGASTDGWTRSTTDILGRVIEVATFSGSSQPSSTGGTTASNFTGRVVSTYDLNTTTIKDQTDKERKSVTNALGQLTKIYEDPNGVNFETSYFYDVLGNLRRVKQGSGSEIQYRYFMYDSLSRLIRAKNPEQDANSNIALTDSISGNSSWALAYAYDKNGNLTSKTDARNTTTSYTYDGLNRVKTRSYSNDPTSTPTVTYNYDTGVSNAKGRLVSVATSLSTTAYAGYDALGRVSGSSQTTNVAALGQTANNVTYTTSYTYNLAGALVSETYPSGRVVTNQFDKIGRLTNVSSNASGQTSRTYANGFTYNAAGAVSSLRLGNGRYESTTFNSRLQPTQIALGTSANNTSLLKLNYTYGVRDGQGNLDAKKNNGNVESQTITVSGMSHPLVQSYTYDSLNRITSATETSNGAQTWKQTFSYDRYGNRNFDLNNTTTPDTQTNGAVKVINPEILASNNRFKLDQDNDSVNDYLYDSAGNLTQDATGKKFKYDAENKQTSFGTGGSDTNGGSYFYDGDGQRVKKIVGSETTIFVYNASGQLVAEYATTTPTNPTISYLTTDTLGTPRINTDANGQVTARHDYLPFGEEIIGLGNRQSSNGYQDDDISQKFTGQIRDEESGLDYFEARYYGSKLGRFTSLDPLLESGRAIRPQSWNRYAYVLNNPMRFTDPDGLIENDPIENDPTEEPEGQEQQQNQNKTDCPQEGYCLVYQEIGKQTHLRGDVRAGKPAFGVERNFIFRVFKDGTPLTPSTAEGVTVEENVEKKEVTIFSPDGTKKMPAPKEITDNITDKETKGPQPLFTKEGGPSGKGGQAGDKQSFTVTTKGAYDELAGMGITSKDTVTFTVKVNGKAVASRTIISTKTLTNISIEIKPNK